MSEILTDYDDIRYPIDANRLQGRLWRIWARDVVAARRGVAAPESGDKANPVEREARIAPRAVSAPAMNDSCAGEEFKSDVSGSPSESRCSPAHLANILRARDEAEAKGLKAVRR